MLHRTCWTQVSALKRFNWLILVSIDSDCGLGSTTNKALPVLTTTVNRWFPRDLRDIDDSGYWLGQWETFLIGWAHAQNTEWSPPLPSVHYSTTLFSFPWWIYFVGALVSTWFGGVFRFQRRRVNWYRHRCFDIYVSLKLSPTSNYLSKITIR